MNRFSPKFQYMKTYKNEANLDAALTRLGLTDRRHIVYRFESGRVTAMFIGTDNADVIHAGFPVVN